jgi:glycosyltransferase involved in cell wall biosynthesis
MISNDMKKVLVLSYHFLPMDVIASYRAYAYAQHLQSFGYRPTIVTHYWEKDEQGLFSFQSTDTPSRFTQHATFDLLEVPRLTEKSFSFLPSKVSVIGKWLKGNLDYKLNSSYKSYYQHVCAHLSEHKYDFALAIFSPHHHLRLAYELKKRFALPYVLDFRDLWNNRIIHLNYAPSYKEKIQDALTVHYWKKWLNEAEFFTITSDEWKLKLKQITGTTTEGYVVHNGFDGDILSDPLPTSKFTLLHAGSLYENQDLDILFSALKILKTKVNLNDFNVVFLGADRQAYNQPNKKYTGGFLYEPITRLKHGIPDFPVSITKRVPKEEVFSAMRDASILLFPSFSNEPGRHTGKIFDYLKSNRIIISFPKDLGVIDDLLEETQTGVSCKDAQELADVLLSKYLQWKKLGYVPTMGNYEAIYKYSRRSQVQRMADLLGYLN